MTPKILLPAALLLLASYAGCSSKVTPPVPVALPAPASRPTARSLSEHPALGELGVPMGTVVEIEATVVAGRETRTKADDGRYLLRVTSIDGRPFADSPLFEFFVPKWVHAHLANDTFDLAEMQTGKKPGELDSSQIAKLEEGYVGKRVRLVCWEIGAYSGAPNDLPQDVSWWQDRGFGFSTWLWIGAERP